MDVRKNPISNELWSWIRYRLIQAGCPTLKSLAAKHNYSKESFLIVKNYAFPNVEKIISETIGMAPQDLFQNRYTSDGKPIGRNYPRQIRLSERQKIRNGKNKRLKNYKERDNDR